MNDADSATILLVDENPINVRLLHQGLKGLGRLLFATTGPDALRLIQDRAIDLVLLDMNMPGMSGNEICREIKKKWPEIPVIFVTSHQEVEKEVDALLSGAIDFLHKPFNPPTIRARVTAHLKAKHQNDLIKNLLHLDPLTEISNRRALDDRILKEWVNCHELREPLTLMMIDVDFFKRYNDHYGHIAGDRCLQLVAKAIRDSVRKPGLAARYGGEEFAVLLPRMSLEEGLMVAQRVIENVRGLEEPHAQSEAAGCVTVSIGVSSLYPSEGPLEAPNVPNPGLAVAAPLFKKADDALYEAKSKGRNQAASR